jgi:hypothetical protein
MLIPCLTYFSTLKMETIFSSETSVGFRRITPRYIPEVCGWLYLFALGYLTTLSVVSFG